MSIQVSSASPWVKSTLVCAVALGLAQVLILSVIYKHILDFDCSDNGIEGFCNFFSGIVTSTLSLCAFLALFAIIRRAELQQLVNGRQPWVGPLLLNALGFGCLLMPLLFLKEGLASSAVWATGAFWMAGTVAVAIGILLLVASPAKWRVFLAQNGALFVPMMLIGALTPVASSALRPIWNLEGITTFTFDAVAMVTAWFGYNVETFPQDRIIGAGDFWLLVSHLCSGLEGVALVTIFIAAYLYLMRKELRFPLALILIPIGIIASLTLNILRIVLLLIIGLNGNPELAVGGFHSHAGWLMFMLISLSVVLASHNIPALQAARQGDVAAPQKQLPPFFQDMVVARILPFAALMFTAVAASTFSQNPGEVYPLRIAVVALVLLPFVPLYRKLDWHVTMPAVLTGVAVAALWIAVPHAPSDIPPFGALTGAALVVWFIARGIGTAIIIPIVEELFFRDYLAKRLSIGSGKAAPYIGLLISTVLFAALHDRWAEAFVAGLAFGWLYYRRGRIVDAIIAHAVANALIFGYAAWLWDFSLV